MVSGNNNQYRLCDLELFAPMRSRSKAEPSDITSSESVPLIRVNNHDNSWLHRVLDEILEWAKEESRSLEGRNALYRTGEWNDLRQKLLDLAKLFPREEPRYEQCDEYYSRCECDDNHVLY